MPATSDFRAQTELGALCRELLADLERLRPGLPCGSEAELLEAARARADVRLGELHRERHAVLEELGEGAAEAQQQLALYRREVEQILLPRWASLALRQGRAERAPRAVLRGADGFNRATWALISLLIGAFVVWAPFIPIWDKWIPFAAGALAAYFAPALPDLHGALLRRRHEVGLLALLIDLDRAGEALPAAPQAAGLPARGQAETSAARASQTAKSEGSSEKGPS